MFDKIFGWGKKKEDGSPADPGIPFGRYSDNNKPIAKVNRWTDADNFFKEKKYQESMDAFFEYLRDDNIENVIYKKGPDQTEFQLFQGSKIVRGIITPERVRAEVTLAKMPQPSVPVMRRLLEMNFNLYYSRFALDEERLCMRFDSDIAAATPSKMYYGLKELGTKADKQDDLLVQDFSILQTTDSEHVTAIPEREKEIKFDFLQKWLKQTLDAISAVDADKFSGGVAYMLLSLVYRIDYLITPEGKLLNELEKIAGVYFLKDYRPVVEKNRDMIDSFKQLQLRPKEEMMAFLFRSKYTFAIVTPQVYKTIADSIHGSNQNFGWYRDNNYPFIATQIAEYGISYCQYSYSLPRMITDLFHLYMRVNYADYFTALGFKDPLYNATTNQFNTQAINDRIKEIQDQWRSKYPMANFQTQNLKFDSLVNFDFSFTNELELLNMESK